MFRIKRLDFYLLTTFLPLFIMTFGICLFIFLMQFLWMYVDEMVGKGIEIHILFQLFYYAAMRFVPQSLPLAILFASLMTFGNLGEQLELLAMKSSGISLMRIMRPLIIFLVFISVGIFYFQDHIIPDSQVKFYTILMSVKRKSPELEIPEKIFYSEIQGKNFYVKQKDKKKKLLKDVMIYDYTEGFNYTRVVVADSGRIKTSTDKQYLVLTLYNGESFQNFKQEKNRAREANDAVPYRRESFDEMEMLIEFDSNFNMWDEAVYKDRHIAKNLASLKQSIDSMTVRLDSIKEKESKALFDNSYRKSLARYENPRPQLTEETESPEIKKHLDFDSLYNAQDEKTKAALMDFSKRTIDNLRANYDYKSSGYEDREIRWHHTEMHRKFTLSFACLIFFFIGAPLGAIIRKGGLGAPAVLSVFLFIVYYIVDITGYKFARDAIWLPWQGMWFSSAILLPLGIFLTYKAVNDSVLLNAETYLDTFRRLIGKREYRKIEMKTIIMEKPDYDEVKTLLQQLQSSCKRYLSNNKRWLRYYGFWKSGGIDYEAERIVNQLEDAVEILRNSDQNIILNKTMDFPVMKNYQLTNLRISPKTGVAMAIFIPVGGIVYLIAVYRRKLLHQDMNATIRVCDDLVTIIDDKIYNISTHATV